MIKTSRQLKDYIKNKAKETNLPNNSILQTYMLEKLVERVATSKYRDKFVLKGGMLISAIIGTSARTTMDLDTTLKNFPADLDKVQVALEEIVSTKADDLIEFKLIKIEDIREDDEYNGYRASIECTFDTIKLTLKMDITVGSPITPSELEFEYKLMFEDRSISVLSYNIETVIAEKYETIISRNISNTRMRDFYDIYMLFSLREKNIDKVILKEAIINTSKSRKTYDLINKSYSIIEKILLNNEIQELWLKYTLKFNYAKGIDFLEVMKSVIKIYDIVK